MFTPILRFWKSYGDYFRKWCFKLRNMLKRFFHFSIEWCKRWSAMQTSLQLTYSNINAVDNAKADLLKYWKAIICSQFMSLFIWADQLGANLVTKAPFPSHHPSPHLVIQTTWGRVSLALSKLTRLQGSYEQALWTIMEQYMVSQC